MTRSIIHQPDSRLDLVLERIVDIPRELVWSAWTNARAPQEMVHACAMDNGRLRNRSSPRRYLPHGDALAGGTGVSERRLLP
jgi:hypothetical protein